VLVDCFKRSWILKDLGNRVSTQYETDAGRTPIGTSIVLMKICIYNIYTHTHTYIYIYSIIYINNIYYIYIYILLKYGCWRVNNARDNIATSTIVVASSREEQRSDRQELVTKHSLDKITYHRFEINKMEKQFVRPVTIDRTWIFRRACRFDVRLTWREATKYTCKEFAQIIIVGYPPEKYPQRFRQILLSPKCILGEKNGRKRNSR